MLLLAFLSTPVPAEQASLSREDFTAGVAALQARLDAIAQSARGVHGNDYLAEVISRPTGDYIAIVVTALSNDPQTDTVCDSVRRHFLGRLTGAADAEQLQGASTALMQALFLPSDKGGKPAVYARELAGKASLTIALSWRKCAGWLTDWHAIN